MAQRTRDARGEPPSGFEASLHRIGKVGTIALVVIIVALLGGAGLLAGALMEQEVDLDRPALGEEGAPTAFAPGSAGDVLLALKQPLGQVPGPSPSPEPVVPAPGGGFDLGGVVNIPVPAPWQVQVGDPGDTFLVLQMEGGGGYATWTLGTTDPANDAVTVLLAAFEDQIASVETYSDLAIGDVSVLQPFGSLVSYAAMPYTGVWVDSQGALPFYGEFYVLVRNDGAVLVGMLESFPPEDWEGFLPDFGTMLFGAAESFAGAPSPAA